MAQATRLYVGNLPDDVSTKEVDDMFYKFGKIRNLDVKKTASGAAFAFIEYDDPRDADDAIRGVLEIISHLPGVPNVMSYCS